ncbi:MAG TPA: chemotaxis protein CheW [Pseudomonadales bacterium]|jgi:twitching motility protein PilI
MSTRDPFTLLFELSERSRASARGLPAQVDIKQYWSGIGFRICGRRLVAPMGDIAEVLEVPGSTRLPGVKSWVRGVANVRGRLLPIVDFEDYFGSTLSGNRKNRRVLTLDTGDIYCGLVVSEVFGMQHFPVDAYTDEALDCGNAFLQALLKGAFVQGETFWGLFDAASLLENDVFLNAAAQVA